MKFLKQTTILLLLAVLTFSVSAQKKTTVFDRNVLVEVGPDDETTSLEVFSLPKDGELRYYLSVGPVGIGNKVVQVYADPISELFIPLGNTLDESMKTLETINDYFKMPKGSENTILGCLTPILPKDDTEVFKVTTGKQLFSRYVVFSIQRDEYLREAQISKSEFRNLMNSMKFYRKFHPKEK